MAIFLGYKLTVGEKSVCVKALNLLLHQISLNMHIFCCRLSFCFVILRATIYQSLKLKPINQNPLIVLLTTEKTNLSKKELKSLYNLRKQKRLLIYPKSPERRHCCCHREKCLHQQNERYYF